VTKPLEQAAIQNTSNVAFDLSEISEKSSSLKIAKKVVQRYFLGFEVLFYKYESPVVIKIWPINRF
jgi:hypothetical protein